MSKVVMKIDPRLNATTKGIQVILNAWRQRGYELVQIISGKMFVFEKN